MKLKVIDMESTYLIISKAVWTRNSLTMSRDTELVSKTITEWNKQLPSGAIDARVKFAGSLPPKLLRCHILIVRLQYIMRMYCHCIHSTSEWIIAQKYQLTVTTLH